MNKMGATVEITAQLIQNHIRTVFECLGPLLGMANAPMVTYFTNKLWNTHVPVEIQREIQTTDDINEAVEIYWKHLDAEQIDPVANDRFKHFRAFLTRARRHHLDYFDDVWVTPEKLKQILDAHHRTTLPIGGFMSEKKNHEVRAVIGGYFLGFTFWSIVCLFSFKLMFILLAIGADSCRCDCKHLCIEAK